MNITKDVIKVVQQSLNKHYRMSLQPDGIAGNKTATALLKITAVPSHWKLERQIIGYVQYICNFEGIDAGPIDGYWGPQTEYGYEQLVNIFQGKPNEPWRKDEGIGTIPDPNAQWPLQTQQELKLFYGNVGENQTKIRVPYPLKIAWAPEKTVNVITCHAKVQQSVLRVLTEVKNHYGIERIKALRLDYWGGCLNVRKLRGGTNWSTHAWGIALDWDPERNRLRWDKNRAQLSRPEYNMWWKFWEDEGWNSLGRERNYDWMHVAAVQVRKT